MPDAVVPSARPPAPAGMIDPRGHRFGAAISATMLVAAWLADAPALVAVALLSIATSAALGLRWSVYGAVWRRLARRLRLRPTELEHEYPPRFAQTLGSVALALSVVGFVLGAAALGWALALAVAGLQAVLAATGYCLGCRLFFLRWWVPGLVTAAWSRGRTPGPAGAQARIRLR